MRILFVHRNDFHKRPPVISAIQYLSELGFHPHVITSGINENFIGKLKEWNVDYTLIPFKMTNSIVHNAIAGYQWGVKARKEIRRIAGNEEILLWVEGNYTFTSLTLDFINRYPHICQVQEIPNIQSRKGRYQLGVLSKIMPTALLNFAPEYNRACIYMAWFKMRKMPFILPNKPAFLPAKEELGVMGEKYKEIVEKINGRKVILYQGSLYKERNLENFLKATKSLDEKEYVTVLLGEWTKELDNYFKINPNIIHVDYLPAPDYLYITSLAHIGLVTYMPDQLNTIYCAPNKIFEYSAFGIPMIGNDIPGLKYTIDKAGCGVVCDDKSAEDIKRGLATVLNNYNEMSKNANVFFESVDNKQTINKAIETISHELNVKFE